MNGLLACWMLLGGSGFAHAQDKAESAEPIKANEQPNPVANGGFEKWRPLKSDEATLFNNSRKPDPQTEQALAKMQWPDGWFPRVDAGREIKWGIGDVGVIADPAVKKEGACSIRMVNRNHDVSLALAQRFDAGPDTRYQVKMWVKGENVDAYHPKGVLVHLVASSHDNRKDPDLWAGKLYYECKAPSPNAGTFDWKEFVFTFDTPPQTRTILLSLELRGAGAVWLDGVQVLEREKIVRVESY